MSYKRGGRSSEGSNTVYKNEMECERKDSDYKLSMGYNYSFHNTFHDA